jgi:hypothetical protein
LGADAGADVVAAVAKRSRKLAAMSFITTLVLRPLSAKRYRVKREASIIAESGCPLVADQAIINPSTRWRGLL